MNIQSWKTSAVKPYGKNPRRNDGAVDAVAASIREFGFKQPIVVDADGIIIVGHTRLKAAKKLGLKEVPVLVADDLSPEKVKAYRLADNKVGELAEWDFQTLYNELEDLSNLNLDFDLHEMGFDTTAPVNNGENENNERKYKGGGNGVLAEKYLFPPFSILDGRSGRWMKRKQEWHNCLKCDSRNGRAEGLLGEGLKELAKEMGRKNLNGTSEFDPVLCEILQRWFCKKGGKIIDPFAGGHVRGTVAMTLGNRYYGVDIREEQIKENYDSLAAIREYGGACYKDVCCPSWFCGDSKNIRQILCKNAPFDFLLMCPPYGDLERYSNDPNDISNMQYDDFLAAYRFIITETVAMLSENSYAAVVISDIRDKKGFYRGFYSDTIQSFEDAGCKLYNDIIKIDPIGPKVLCAGKQFSTMRKVVRTHQNVLVFAKGSPKSIECSEYNFDFSELELTGSADSELDNGQI